MPSASSPDPWRRAHCAPQVRSVSQGQAIQATGASNPAEIGRTRPMGGPRAGVRWRARLFRGVPHSPPGETEGVEGSTRRSRGGWNAKPAVSNDVRLFCSPDPWRRKGHPFNRNGRPPTRRSSPPPRHLWCAGGRAGRSRPPWAWRPYRIPCAKPLANAMARECRRDPDVCFRV